MATSTSTSTSPLQSTTADPFDSLLTLEDEFYAQGYNQGVADGLVAGRTEGRQLGLERGFQKFLESGRLQGRAIVWANRLGRQKTARPRPPRSDLKVEQGQKQQQPGVASELQRGIGRGGESMPEDGDGEGASEERKASAPAPARFELPPLPANPRLGKHIATLYALAETESLSTENTDEAVDEFDDRLRRAQGRAKIIERMVGEGSSVGGERHGEVNGHDLGLGKGERGEDV
ncbi:hypothetical protein VTK56DRAFT_6556 [Thermocarpiscus australiensis]